MLINYFDTYFTTCTIHNWKLLLNSNRLKSIITSSFYYLVKNRRVRIIAFVIMPNHLHIVWEIIHPFTLVKVQQSLLSFTAHQFLKYLRTYNTSYLREFYVGKRDRQYQLWQTGSLSKPILSTKMLSQKIDYIHFNPCQPHWNLVTDPINYKFSSAKNYMTDYSDWDFITRV